MKLIFMTTKPDNSKMIDSTVPTSESDALTAATPAASLHSSDETKYPHLGRVVFQAVVILLPVECSANVLIYSYGTHQHERERPDPGDDVAHAVMRDLEN